MTRYWRWGLTRWVMRRALALVLGCLATGVALAVPVAGQGTWETSLHARDLDNKLANGPEAFYDSALNITWLRDGNYLGTLRFTNHFFDSTGKVTRYDAAQFVFDVNYQQPWFGYDEWRLPQTVDLGAIGCQRTFTGQAGRDCGYNIQEPTSELAHLFYVTLGNLALCDPALSSDERNLCSRVRTGYGLVNTGDFVNLQLDEYWYGTAAGCLYCFDLNWIFDFRDGWQGMDSTIEPRYMMLVHPGDIGRAMVPLPSIGWLLAVAGLAAWGARRLNKI